MNSYKYKGSATILAVSLLLTSFTAKAGTFTQDLVRPSAAQGIFDQLDASLLQADDTQLIADHASLLASNSYLPKPEVDPSINQRRNRT